MQSNLTRYESDLARLVDDGTFLAAAMQLEQGGERFKKEFERVLGDRAEETRKKVPHFASEYQRWYSEAKALIRQVIPDRLADFVRHYERQANRKVLQADNYTIEDYLQRLSRGDFVSMKAGISRMEQQLFILKSAQQRFKSSLFDIRQLVAADLFDGEIDAARALAKNGFLRAAGAVCGVVLEKHLTQVCENHKVTLAKKHPTIADLNDALKNADVIDTPRWRANQHLADVRNLCDHAKAKEPTKEQVGELIEGVAKVLKTLF